MEKEVEQKNKATQAMEWVGSKMPSRSKSSSSEKKMTEEEKLRKAEDR